MTKVHDGIYYQKDGLAMDSPPAPMLANGWLSQFDKEIQGNSKIFFRYMDDILKDIKVCECEHTLSMINNFHRNLKFTIER